MSHFYKVRWIIVDQNGNSVDGVSYHSNNAASSVMNSLIATDASLKLSVKELMQLIF